MNTNKFNDTLLMLLAIIFLFNAAPMKAQTCSTAPVGLLSNYAAESNASDARSRNNGTVQGNVSYVSGKVGQTFQLGGNGDLSGSGDRVIVGNPASLQLQDLTIETWVKRSSSAILTNSPFPGSPNGTIFAYGQNGYGFVIDQNTNKLGLTNVGNSVVNSNLGITDTNWHHIAVTKSGNQVTFYVDGTADTPTTYTTTFGFTTNAAIGARGDNNVQNAFFGAVDELSIYNRPLAASQIQEIFNAGTTGKCKPLATYAPDNQVLWLTGDGSANDSSGSGNDGTTGSNTVFTLGKVGQAFQFDGTQQSQIIVPDTQSLRPATAVTVDAWINPSSVGTGFQGVLFKGNTGSPGGQPYSIFVNGNNHQIVVRIGNDSTFEALSSVGGIPVNVYSHVAFTYDGTTIRIYINGVLDTSAASSVGTLAQTDTNVLRIGGLGGSFNFIGGVDEIGIYNRALTVAEIQSISNAGLAGKYKVQTTVPANIAAWYAGDGNTNDLQSANNAALQNGATYGNGKVGQGFQFDGVDDQIIAPHNANQNGGSNLTVEAWINPASLAHGGTIVQKRTSGNVGGYLLELTQPSGGGAPNGLQFVIMIGGVYQTLNPANIVTANVWQHVAATYDGSFMKIYVNGVEVGNRAQTGTIDAVTVPVQIGRNIVNNTAFQGGIDEIALYNRALTASEISNIYYAQSGGKYKAASVPTVSNKTKTGDVELTFANLTATGTAHETMLDEAKLPAIPNTLTATGLYYDVSTNAAFTGNITECFNLTLSGNAFGTMTNFSNLKLLHLEAGVWQDRTTSANFATRTLCGQTTSLSPFAIALNYMPTAANIILSGKVQTAKGGGIANVRVTLIDYAGQKRTVLTNSFGYYRFTEINAGRVYTVSVSAKNYVFDNPIQIVSVVDNLSELNFTALALGKN